MPAARRAVLVALLATLFVSTPTGQPAQADGLARLLSNIQSALASGRLDAFRALATTPLAPDDEESFAHQAMRPGGPSTVVLKQRSKADLDGVTHVLVEIFTSRDRRGRVATWDLAVRKRAAATDDSYDLLGLTELAAIDELNQLALDTTRQFAVHNFSYSATDFTLKMASGTAFVSQSAEGTALLVLRGNGDVLFNPQNVGEQGQLEEYTGRPELKTKIDSAVIRVNPADSALKLSEHALVPGAVDPAELRRAQEIFDLLVPLWYNVDLRDLSRERWSIEPRPGGKVVEFRSSRHGWLTYVRSPSEPEDISLFKRAEQRNLSIYTSADALASRGRFYSEDTAVPYDIEAYAIDLTFDPARYSISGHGLLRIRTKNSGLSSVTLKLATSLNVSSVTSPRFGQLLALRAVGQNSLIVSLPTDLPKDSVFVIDVTYSGRLPPQKPEKDVIDVIGQGQSIADLANAGFGPEPRFFYSNAVAWYPQSTVNDYAVATMRVTLPVDYQVAATGSADPLTEVAPSPTAAAPAAAAAASPGKRLHTVQFQADRPVRYLALVMTKLAQVGTASVPVPRVAPPVAGVQDTGEKSVRLEVLSTPRQVPTNRWALDETTDIIKFYANMIGEAPYPSFTLAAVEDNLPGGNSPPFLGIWKRPLTTTNMVWADDPAVFDRYPGFILAHEVAHQWWGAAVGVKNYHEQWLSEGLAQYFGLLYVASDRGPEAMRNLLILMRQTSMSYSSRGPIYLGYRLQYLGERDHVFRAIVYNKSGSVLHMLRRLIGEDAFLAGIRRYYREWRFQKAGLDDFRKAFEAETPIRLTRFFDKWVIGSSLAKARVTSHIDAATKTATVRVEQIGETFDYPLNVNVQYADGRSEDIVIPVTDAVVEHKIQLKGAVKRISAKEEFSLVTISG